jgi:hypothetical protein
MRLRQTLGWLIISASISSLLMVGCDRQRKFDKVPPNPPTPQSETIS